MMFTNRISAQQIEHNRIEAEFYDPKKLEKLSWRSDWEARSELLDNLCDFITDGTHITPDYKPRGVKFLSSKNIDPFLIDFTDTNFISENEHIKLGKSKCNPLPGDILLAKNGRIGTAAIYRNEYEPCSLFVSVALLRYKGILDPDFVVAFLNSSGGWYQFTRSAKTGVITNLHLEEIREVWIPKPIKQAQTYIGDKVRLAERLRERSRILAADIQDKMQECFYGNPKPRPSKHHRINSDVLTANRLEYEFYTPLGLWADAEIRGSQWQYKRLADISLRIKDGPGGWGVSTSDYVNIGVPVIRAINLIDGECDLTDCVYISNKKHKELASHTVKQNSVLLSVRGTIGRAAVFESDEYKEANLNAAVVTIDCNNEILPHFLAEFFNTAVGKIQSQRMANGAVQLNMNLEETGNNLIVVPPKDFQEKIVILRQNRLATKSFSEKLTTAAKFLVEALIEGKLTEDELKIAQEALQKGDRESDKAILSRLTRKGYDIKGEPPLFPDLDLLYQTIDQLNADEQGK